MNQKSYLTQTTNQKPNFSDMGNTVTDVDVDSVKEESDLPYIQDMYEAKQFLSKMLHLAATGYGKLSSRQTILKNKIEEFLEGKRPANIGGRKYYYQDLLDLIFED